MRKYQYYDTGADGDRDAYSNNWGGQTFTPEMSHLLASVKLKLFRVGTPGTLKVSIRATLAGEPAGGDLCSGEIDADTLTIDTNGEWYEITLGDGYEVEAGTTYAIVIRATTGDTDNKVSWRADTSSPTYLGGSYTSSSDSGTDWDTFSGVDTMFEIWGTGPPSPTTVTWGNLLKSQISAEKIEEAVIRMIQNHENDVDAHLEIGESLYSHKASEIIDHIVNSIITDKIKDAEITPPKLYDFNELRISTNFESGDAWDMGGNTVSFSLGGCFLGRVIGDPDEMYITAGAVAFPITWTKRFTAQFTIKLYNHIDNDFYFVAGKHFSDLNEQQSAGFKYSGNKLYSYTRSQNGYPGVETTTEITGIDVGNPHTYRVEFYPDSKIEFYIDNILKTTHTADLPTSSFSSGYFTFECIDVTAGNSIIAIHHPYLVMER